MKNGGADIDTIMSYIVNADKKMAFIMQNKPYSYEGYRSVTAGGDATSDSEDDEDDAQHRESSSPSLLPDVDENGDTRDDIVRGAKELWGFLYKSIYPNVFTSLQNYLSTGLSVEVSIAEVQKNLDVSDEAITLLILNVKQGEILEEMKEWKKQLAGSTGVAAGSPGGQSTSTNSSDRDAGSDGLAGNKRSADGIVKSKKKGGRQKGAKKTGENATELQSKMNVYMTVAASLTEKRANESNLGWYKAVTDVYEDERKRAGDLKEQGKEEDRTEKVLDSLEKWCKELGGDAQVFLDIGGCLGEGQAMNILEDVTPSRSEQFPPMPPLQANGEYQN